MAFRVEWKKSTRKDLRRLPQVTVDRVIEAVESLAQNPFPHGVEKLSGAEHAYRIRLGDYRVVYEVVTELKLVEIQRVRHRKDVYRCKNFLSWHAVMAALKGDAKPVSTENEQT